MTELVFSRRALQQCLFDLEAVLSASAHADLIERLERRGKGRLPAMWEVVWLHALSSVATIVHEGPLRDGRRPDFAFSLHNAGGIQVLGDITSVSDKGLHESNPVSSFWDGVVAIARKHGINPDRLQYRIGDRKVGVYPDIRTVLMLPARKDMQAFLKEQVTPFIRRIARDKPAKDLWQFSSEDVRLSLGYDEKQEYAAGGHAVYNLPRSAKRNPIATALEKKARQLRGAPSDSLRLLILCDAGCYALNSVPWGGDSLTAGQVVQNFFRTSSAIDAVLLVATEPVERYKLHDRRVRLNFLWGARPHARSPDLARALPELRKLLDAAIAMMPQPMLDPQNASYRVDRPGYGHGSLGMEMSNNKIRISARQVLELLAGKMTFEQLAHNYRWGDADGWGNPFAYELQRGRTITATKIDPGGDADDDWFEFEFGRPDAAIGPFRRKGDS